LRAPLEEATEVSEATFKPGDRVRFTKAVGAIDPTMPYAFTETYAPGAEGVVVKSPQGPHAERMRASIEDGWLWVEPIVQEGRTLGDVSLVVPTPEDFLEAVSG
jgi:hypothetical protein